MCTYCSTKNYYKIYENHHGPIGKDADGRTMEVHHIDGNHENNNPGNLTLVTIQEHYDIHYLNGDVWAAWGIASRMKLSQEEISELAKQANKKKIDAGKHHWQDSEWQRQYNLKRVDDGTHNLLKRPDGSSQSSDRVAAGTHSFLGSNLQKEKFKNGSHPTQNKICCIYCKSIVGQHAFNRKHGDNCDKNTDSPFYKMNLVFNKKVWWNNGIIERKGFSCPNETWEKGRIPNKHGKSKPPSSVGKLRWHKGNEEKVSATCPGPGWERGGKSRKTKVMS